MQLSKDGYRKMDTVKSSRILMDAAALAAAVNRPLEMVDGQPALRIESGAELAFVPSLRDLRDADQVIAVYRTGSGSVRPHLGIELASRTDGLNANDSLSTGTGALTLFENRWGEYPFPWENFLIFGMGELVYPIAEMKLCFQGASAASPVWLKEIRAELRDRASGPRLTDAGLCAVLNGFDGPGLLEHLRRRERPISKYGQKPLPLADSTLRLADDICRNVIHGYDLGDPVDWHINPNGYLEWMHALNRHSWINTLLAAYRETQDPRYVQTLDALWISWLRDNPEPVGHNGGGDPAWETLSTAIRVYVAWLEAFFALLHDPLFRDSTRLEILKSLYAHAEHLCEHKGHANNWLIVESRVLFVLGLMFPEFKRAPIWFKEGTARLEKELKLQVWPDGADWEIAPGYHMMACDGFLEPLDLARLNGITLPSVFEERLPATVDYIAGMSRPDGSLPSVNDSGGWRNRHGGSKYLSDGAHRFNRPDWLAGPEGAMAGCSRVFEDAGFHILASGTGRDAMWSFLDGGPPGASHCHEDALNVEFFAFGRPFIVDPGITGYMQDDWTDYYRRSHAHNTVLVNGETQTWSSMSHAERVISARGKAYSRLGKFADLARATYDRPYRNQPAGLSHTRALLFVRGKYWVVFDEITGAAAHSMQARFQFVPSRLIMDRRRRVFRTMRQDLPNLELWALPDTGRISLSMATGETGPVGGWVSDGEDIPAPQARINLQRRPDDHCLRLVTVVYPFATGVGSGSRIRLRPDSPAQRVELLLRHKDGTRDVISYAWDARVWEDQGSDSEMLLSIQTSGATHSLSRTGWV